MDHRNDVRSLCVKNPHILTFLRLILFVHLDYCYELALHYYLDAPIR